MDSACKYGGKPGLFIVPTQIIRRRHGVMTDIICLEVDRITEFGW